MTSVSMVLRACAGGALIGLAGALLWAALGRVCGVSGICAGLLDRLGQRGDGRSELRWRLAFLGGLVGAGALWALAGGAPLTLEAPRRWPIYLVGGVLVGVGARLANGCTSGHGICGFARRSSRSLVATAMFIAVAMAVTAVARVLGGLS
jgi:uncharacterized protein